MDRFVVKKRKLDVAETALDGERDFDTHAAYPIPLPARLPFSFDDAGAAPSPPKELSAPDVLHYTPFVDRARAGLLFDFLRDAMPWYRVEYTVRGIHIRTPRWTTVFGLDATHTWRDGKPHPPGKLKSTPRPIPGCLAQLQRHVELHTGCDFNFCLVNYYADGQDSISWHSDDEHFLGPDPVIASLSLGAARDFAMRRKSDTTEVWRTTLRAGDMVVMRGRTQAEWEHGVPKRKSAGARINITFRKGVVPYATDNYNRYNVGDGPFYRWIDGKMVRQDAKAAKVESRS